MPELHPPTIDDIRAAGRELEGLAVRTPLVRLPVESGDTEIWLKLENLQPIGSFKIRGAGTAMARAPREMLERGVYTASAGNMAQGVAYVARARGIPCTVVVPDHAPRTKLDAITRLGARIIAVPFDRWWQTLEERGYPGLDGFFVHPVSDGDVIAGNGTVGLEILEDLPDVDAILVPFGGGGLSSGIAAAVRALRPATKVFGCEVETAAPLRASLAAGHAARCEYIPSFVDGIGGRSVLAEMWPLVSTLLDGALTVSIAEVARAVKLLVERARVVAEGAGAASVAAAMTKLVDAQRVVCVISGGNIDTNVLAKLLATDN
jgi:threonine dehydratase